MSQPLDQVYQNPVMTRQPTNPSPRSANGSFGPVFIVLAVIVVVSAVACVLGRVCSKRHHRSKEGSHKPKKASGKQGQGQSQGQGLGPKEWESRQKPMNFNMRDGGDIEFGFDKKSSKGPKTTNGGGGGGGGNSKPTHSYNNNNNNNSNNYNNHNNGGYRPDQVRFADNV